MTSLGAQSTIMTQSCAQICGIDHLIDKRFSGKAFGVGTGIIIGKIHLVDMKIGTAHFPVTIVRETIIYGILINNFSDSHVIMIRLSWRKWHHRMT
jgi:hypothetical protein